MAQKILGNLEVVGNTTIDGNPTYATGVQTFTINPTNTSSWQVVAPANSWCLSASMSYDGSVQYLARLAALYKSTDSGTTFSQISDPFGGAGGSQYYSVACDSDGSFVTMTSSSSSAAYQGLWISTNSGGSWTYVTNTPAGYYQKFYWSGCNNDGSTIIALRDPNIFYVSTNGGSSWSSARYLPNSYSPTVMYGGNGGACAMSSTGTYLAAVANGSGNYPTIYVSTDSGSSWGSGYTIPSASPSSNCCIAMDADGSHIIAAVMNSGIDAVCISTNYGASWTTSAGPGHFSYLRAAISGDGQRMVLCTDSGNDGKIYVSNNAGSSWTQQSTGVSGSPAWKALAISGDGTNITATHDNSGNSVANNSPTTKFIIGNTAITSLNYAIGGNLTTTLDNIVTYFNNQGSRNTNAAKTSGTQITYTAVVPGTAGNSLVTTHSKDGDNVYSFGGATLSGGLDAGGLITSNGYINFGTTLVTPTTGHGDIGDVVCGGDLEIKGKIANTILQTSLDGYAQVPYLGATGDGYVSFFTGTSRQFAGDNDFYWNRSANRLSLRLGSTDVGVSLNPLIIGVTTAASADIWHSTNIACVDSRANANGVGGGMLFIGKDSGQGYYAMGGIRGAFSTSLNAGCTDIYARGGLIRFYNASSMIIDSFTPQMTINSSGNVGIGTSSQANKLDVSGAVAIGSYAGTSAPSNGLIVSGSLAVGTSSTTYKLHATGGRCAMVGTAETYTLAIGRNDYSGAYWLGCNANATPDLLFSNVAGTERMRIGDNGTVTIGTTSAAGKLFVYGDSAGSDVITLSRGSSYTWTWKVEGSSDVSFRASSTNVLYMKYTGEVGIATGSNAFTNKLSVYGAASIGTSVINISAPSDGLLVGGKILCGGGTSFTGTGAQGAEIRSSASGHVVCLNRTGGYRYYLDIDGNGHFDIMDDDQTTSRIHVHQGTGRVGIGTTSPASLLHVYNGAITLNNSTTQVTPDRYLGSGSGNCITWDNGLGTIINSTAHMLFNIDSDNGESGRRFVFATNSDKYSSVYDGSSPGTQLLVIQDNGYSGFGIPAGTNPQNTLDIKGSAIIGSSYAGTYTAPSNGLAVQGNVGIGTQGPGYNLEVSGNARVSGYFIVGTVPTQVPPTNGDIWINSGSQMVLKASQSGLWVSNNNTLTETSIYLATTWNNDQQVQFRYVPGTTGAGAGVLSIGQLVKNDTNYTHGITAFYTNGTEKMRINKDGYVGIGTSTPTAKLEVAGNIAGPKVMMTPEGGVAIKITNKTGLSSVKGSIACADTTTDNAFKLEETSGIDPIGIVYESGIADGYETWIVISGIAEVLLQDSTASTRGYWVRTSTTTAGRADATSAAPPGGTIGALEAHMAEIGHCIESKTAGTDVLAKCIIHFN